MNCFVCSDWLDGDERYVQSHLNRCLDRQGSSAEPRSLDTCTASTSFSQDEALALSIAREQSSHVDSHHNNNDDNVEELLCPCCQVLWQDINLSLPSTSTSSSSSSFPVDDNVTVQEKRRKHVMKCLEARSRNGFNQEDEGEEEDALQHGRYEDDDDEQAPHSEGSSGSKSRRRGTIGWTGGIGTKAQVSSTRGLVGVLDRALEKSHSSRYGKTCVAYLASDRVEHVGTKFGDWGWGCGYKNLQMLLSSATSLPQYRQLLNDLTSRMIEGGGGASGEIPIPIPTILELQEIIQSAWAHGFDPLGARHFNHKLIGSRRWIGTTEVFTALTFIGIRARIVDFPKVKKGQDSTTDETHQTLIKWILSYFSTPPPPLHSSSTSSQIHQPGSSSFTIKAHDTPKNAYETLLFSASQPPSSPIKRVSQTKQPLYLQHQGHSRTIVGIERMKSSSSSNTSGTTTTTTGGGQGEEWLLIFDPGRPISNELKRLAAAAGQGGGGGGGGGTSLKPQLRDSPPLLKKLKPNGGFGRLTTKNGGGGGGEDEDGFKFGDVLKNFRVNIKDLKKRDEYQILYIEETGSPLNELEKQQRKTVKADRGTSVWRP